jgi:cytochrome c nitrite reductase small subunit
MSGTRTLSPVGESPPTRPKRRRLRSLLGSIALPIWLGLIAILGGQIGIGVFTVVYANGTSYLSDDPKACVNCHVMREQYDGWSHGSHKAVAVCNDCHTPHDSIVSKYAVKAINGVRHSMAFTFGGFPEPIRIADFDRNIAQQNCLSCHRDMVAMISHAGEAEPTDCLRCHAKVGHEP